MTALTCQRCGKPFVRHKVGRPAQRCYSCAEERDKETNLAWSYKWREEHRDEWHLRSAVYTMRYRLANPEKTRDASALVTWKRKARSV